jgi:hypothetical protein
MPRNIFPRSPTTAAPRGNCLGVPSNWSDIVPGPSARASPPPVFPTPEIERSRHSKSVNGQYKTYKLCCDPVRHPVILSPGAPRPSPPPLRSTVAMCLRLEDVNPQGSKIVKRPGERCAARSQGPQFCYSKGSRPLGAPRSAGRRERLRVFASRAAGCAHRGVHQRWEGRPRPRGLFVGDQKLEAAGGRRSAAKGAHTFSRTRSAPGLLCCALLCLGAAQPRGLPSRPPGLASACAILGAGAGGAAGARLRPPRGERGGVSPSHALWQGGAQGSPRARLRRRPVAAAVRFAAGEPRGGGGGGSAWVLSAQDGQQVWGGGRHQVAVQHTCAGPRWPKARGVVAWGARPVGGEWAAREEGGAGRWAGARPRRRLA